MTAPQIVQSIAVILALLSAWAWAKSAMLQTRPDHKPCWIDSHLNWRVAGSIKGDVKKKHFA
jgi:hypothetical protein